MGHREGGEREWQASKKVALNSEHFNFRGVDWELSRRVDPKRGKEDVGLTIT